MNRYGSEIQRSWEMACPDEVRQMDNPEEFFESLGQQASRMISDLTTQLAGPDEPGGDVLSQGGETEPGEDAGRGDSAGRDHGTSRGRGGRPDRPEPPDSDPNYGHAGSPESLREWAEWMDQLDRIKAEVEAEFPDDD